MSIVISDLWVYTGMPSLVVHLNGNQATAAELTAYIEGLEAKAALADEMRGEMKGDHTVFWMADYDKDWAARYDALTTPIAASKGE